MAGALKM
jgi:hypothetical protein